MKTNDKKDIRVIGLTGGIASGKTVATTALRVEGYTVIDADEVSRELFACGTDGERLIMRQFPQAATDGRLDRAALRKIIAKDCNSRQALNALTHPIITAEIKRLIAAAQPPIILSAPLLFETSLCSLCDVTVCVHCPVNIRLQRLISRDGITTDDAKAIIDAQMPDAECCAKADYVVPSDRDQAEFIAQITELINKIVRQ